MSRLTANTSSSPAALTAIQRLAQISVQARDCPAWHPRAATHLLDWLGCAARGAISPQGEAFAGWLKLQGTGTRPTLAGRSSDAAAAAAYHGALGSALEMDDIHRSSILHPGPVIIPALLAAAGPGSSGPDLLSALVAGYEVMIRVGRALGPSHYRMWHSTATAGSFGAAAAASALLGLDAAQTAHALALAGTRAGGLWQVRHESQLGKAWHMAGAARDGLAAAQLAAAGLTGPQGVLDGPSGWFAATAPEADAGMIDAPRSSPWIDDVSFKPWPACRHAHPAIDALKELLGPQARLPQSILKVEVFTYADALRFCDKPNPLDEAQARFSIQHALAALLLWGEPQASHYSAEMLKDPALSALRAIISVHSSAEFEARYPAQYGARVVISWRDGRREESALFDTLGDPARPMSQDAIQTKAATLMTAAGWSPQRIDAAIRACAALPTAATVDALNKVIQPCD